MNFISVTGVVELIGSWLGQGLLDDGHSAFGIDNLKAGLPNIPDGVEFFNADCCSESFY